MSAQHTPGPWAWFGGERSFYLATIHNGRRIVMDFVRRGFADAQPRFQNGGVMVPGTELATFEVGDRNVRGFKEARQNESVYRYDVRGIDHPDARLIAAAPGLLAALRDLVERCYEQTFEISAAGNAAIGPQLLVAADAIAKAEGRS